MKIKSVKKKTLLLFPLIVSSALAVVFCFGCSEATPPKESAKESSNPVRRDNIILISADTLRADHLGCYGYARNTSPNIDEFAKESVFFERAATQAPSTAPAHMSIFTALMPIVHGVKNHNPEEGGSYNRLSDSVLTLPEILKENGYMTAGFTGGGNVAGHLGFDKGFDKYSEAIRWNKVQSNPGQLDEIRKWIRLSRKSGQPIFLFLHNYICHDPYVFSPEEFRFAFLEKRAEGLPVSRDDFDIGKGFETKRDYMEDVDFENPEHLAHMVALYDGGISYMDYVFGETMKVLKEEGIFDDSIIIFLSDHGEGFYEHLTYRHGYLFVENMHVPLIVRFPGGGFAGTRIKNRVRTMDLMPTLFEFLGIDVSQFTQGSSFMPLLTGKGGYDPVLLGYDGQFVGVRLHKDGFIYSNQESPGGSEWLFDEENDPKETQNLAGDKAEILVRMRADTRRFKKSDTALAGKYGHGAEEMREADGETLKQLKNLGYLQ